MYFTLMYAAIAFCTKIGYMADDKGNIVRLC